MTDCVFTPVPGNINVERWEDPMTKKSDLTPVAERSTLSDNFT